MVFSDSLKIPESIDIEHGELTETRASKLVSKEVEHAAVS